MSASDIAAWWGAGLATVVFAWEVYKWATSGPRLVMRLLPNMQSPGGPADDTSVMVEVVNRGDMLTTITHLAVYHYQSRMHKLFDKRKGQGVIPSPGWGPGVPFEIGPGQRWTGAMTQQPLLDTYSGGVIYVVIMHTGSNRDVMQRLVNCK